MRTNSIPRATHQARKCQLVVSGPLSQRVAAGPSRSLFPSSVPRLLHRTQGLPEPQHAPNIAAMKIEAPSGRPSPLPKSRAQSRDRAPRPAVHQRRRSRKPGPPRRVSLEHHVRQCLICGHPLRWQIEQEFLHWVSPRIIAKDYGLGNGNPRGLYRHARAVGLWEKRFSWIRDCLAPILEQSWRVTATPASIVSAVRTIARINAVGQWVEPADRVYLRDLFDRMSREELELYAREGKLPAWFEKEVSATPGILPEPRKDTAGSNPGAGLQPGKLGLPEPRSDTSDPTSSAGLRVSCAALSASRRSSSGPDFVVGKPGKSNPCDPNEDSGKANG
jgi:hypothetical protein